MIAKVLYYLRCYLDHHVEVYKEVLWNHMDQGCQVVQMGPVVREVQAGQGINRSEELGTRSSIRRTSSTTRRVTSSGAFIKIAIIRLSSPSIKTTTTRVSSFWRTTST